jgi:hypothetical protein
MRYSLCQALYMRVFTSATRSIRHSTGMNDITYTRTGTWYYPEAFLERVIYGVLAVIQFILALRLILVLLGASSTSSFVAWFYDFSGGFVAPFTGAFPSFTIAGFTLDLSIIFAMIGYSILAWLLARLVGFFSYLR